MTPGGWTARASYHFGATVSFSIALSRRLDLIWAPYTIIGDGGI
jgi:hypothetical protein